MELQQPIIYVVYVNILVYTKKKHLVFHATILFVGRDENRLTVPGNC